MMSTVPSSRPRLSGAHRAAAAVALTASLFAVPATLAAQGAGGSAQASAAQSSPATSSAVDPAPEPGRRSFDASATIKASTLGFGAEFGKLLTSNLGVRVGGSTLSYDHARAVDEITFDGTLTLRNLQGFVDLFPFRRGAFRLTGGVVSGTSEIDATGIPDAGGEYEIDGQIYAGSDVGTLIADVQFAKTRPYAGFGWGTPASADGGFGFVADFGVVFGAPDLSLAATGPVSGVPEFQASLEAQRQTTQEDLDRYGRFYPLLGVGLS